MTDIYDRRNPAEAVAFARHHNHLGVYNAAIARNDRTGSTFWAEEAAADFALARQWLSFARAWRLDQLLSIAHVAVAGATIGLVR